MKICLQSPALRKLRVENHKRCIKKILNKSCDTLDFLQLLFESYLDIAATKKVTC